MKTVFLKSSARFFTFSALSCVICIIGCTHKNSAPTKDAETYLQAHPEISEASRKAIEAGQILKGMCPNEAIAAAGIPYFYEAQLDSKWPAATDPQLVIEKQCSEPDKSKITLYFENKTQFGKLSKFKVLFQNGQATEISSL
jgi:hypothetical protein